MVPIAVKVDDDSLEVRYPAKDQTDTEPPIVIKYNPEQSIGANLENLRIKMAGIHFDVIIIDNPLSYTFSDTVVGLNHQRIDIGLALTNMFNVPVVARPTVKQRGLETAVADKTTYASWHLDYYGEYTGKRNYGQEAMLTVGNGYYGLRGAYVEATADADNYPGFYVAGVYNQNTTNINGRDVVNEDLVNLPNVQYLSLGVDHGNPFQIRRADIRDIYRSLNLRTGQLQTTMLISLATGHQLVVTTTKVADMRHYHRLAIRYAVTPLNFDGSLQVYAAIDGNVQNRNVDRYNQFDQRHVAVDATTTDHNNAVLTGHTRHSQVHFAIGSQITSPDRDLTAAVRGTQTSTAVRQTVNLTVHAGQTYTIDKLVAVVTDHDGEETDTALTDRVNAELQAGSFDNTAAMTQDFFADTWRRADVVVTGDITSQKLLRVNVFHLLVAGAALGAGHLDASTGARGLHGEAYRGHVFWDEMFCFPFYAEHYPAIARAMIMYRYRRLDAARQYAESVGQHGAMFPWQSAMYGDEQAQSVHLNPLTNQWDPDNSRRQRHVSLSVAYDVWLYDHLTGDHDVMHRYGLEIMLSVARFWLGMATRDEATGRYDINGVMGPDEFHEQYPNSKLGGLSNNAYTNMMVAWLFQTLTQLTKQLPAKVVQQAAAKAGWRDQDTARLTDIAAHLNLDINDDGIIGQFQGYFDLPRLDFDQYRKQYGDIARLDRILKSEGKTPDAYQVAKQADALMAYYVLNHDDVEHLIQGLGYHLPVGYFTHNLQYYLNRTTHGSTLSRIVYAALNEQDGNYDQSWQLFRQALFSDYYDIQGGTTARASISV
nr:glycoside hydrolase family 65 protein [Lacticaseibacillus thailandensis]